MTRRPYAPSVTADRWLEFSERWAWAAAVLVAASGCQAVAGDFSIDTSKLDDLCTPGELRCSTAALQRCESDGMTYDTEEQCASSPLCDSANELCTPPTCESGTMRCSGAEFQTCADDYSQWTTVRTCVATELCEPTVTSGCTSTACEAGALRCNDATLETCTGGRWATTKACATRELCDASGAGACRPPTCAAGERHCLGTSMLETCKTSRDAWAVTSCDGTQQCNSAANRCR